MICAECAKAADTKTAHPKNCDCTCAHRAPREDQKK